MLVGWLVACAAFSFTGAGSFVRRGMNCEEQTMEFGYDIFTSCLFSASNCSSLRTKIVDSINTVMKDIEKIDDGTGKEIRLIKPGWELNCQDDNATDDQCNVPVGVQLKILYNSISLTKSRYTIVGASVRLDENFVLLDNSVRLAWSVMFREVKPKSNISRWWEEMTSREGSSYSLAWILDGFVSEGSGPRLFSLGLAAVSCLLILKPYY